MSDLIDLQELLDRWNPDRPAVAASCANCSNCRIRPDIGGQPKPHCAAGHDAHDRDTWRLFRAYNPSPWRAAQNCPDFASMSD